MAKLHALKEKCMVRTAAGTRCKNGGSQRHADAFHRYAICGQHADMLMEGKQVTFITHITPEVVAEAVNQQRLPGMDVNVQVARDALLADDSSGVKAEVFYVKALEKGKKVALLHKEEIFIPRWSKALCIKTAIDNMPAIEGRVTGIMVRSANNKAVWNRTNSGWVERPVPDGLIIVG